MSILTRKIPLFRYSLHWHISTFFISLITVFALVNIVSQYSHTSRILLSASEALFNRIGIQAVKTIESRYGPTSMFVDLMAHQQIMFAGSLRERLQNLPYFTETLRGNSGLAAVYVGYENGDFFLVRRIDSLQLKQRFEAPDGAVFMVQSIEHRSSDIQGKFLFFNADLRLMRDSPQPEYRYDPRTRPWYKAAIKQSKLYLTNPYLFFTIKEVGTTFARRSENGEAVVGADITLAELSNVLGSQYISPNAELMLFSAGNHVLAYRDPDRIVHKNANGVMQLALVEDVGVPALNQLIRSGRHIVGGRSFDVDGQIWQGYLAPIPVPGGEPIYLAIAAPQRELLSDAMVLRNHALLITAGLLVVSVLVAVWLSRLASSPIRILMDEAREIQALRFDAPIKVSSRIYEIDELAQAMAKMKSTIHNFLDIGQALASERHFDSLITRLLAETTAISRASGGIIYLHEQDGSLRPAQARWGSQAFGDALNLPRLGPDDVAHPAWQTYVQGQIVNTSLDTLALGLLFGTMHSFDYPLTVLAVPLKGKQDDGCVGVLLLLQDERVQHTDQALLALVGAVSGTAAAAIETQRLLQEQKILLESFIQLIAGAIDAKSPYTGGHCQRVPELTKMLARAAERQTEGPYADFKLGPEQWEELHIATWLHDCGKITTPEYVVDKATKLETLYDRIHEVRMRFEVMKRDAEIDYWRAMADGGDPVQLQTLLDEQLHQLDDDFAFIASCNIGDEFMAPEKIARVKAIAARTWRRTLSDRIGISYEETVRKMLTMEPDLPVRELLLADRPDHLFPRGPHDQLPLGHGFDMQVPTHLYNRGEVYNLCVARGTLCVEERYKINEHIVQTIVMLNKLPFPRHLQHVPEIAGGHHEKMDGTGYPKRLKRDEMSLTARMMAIADIFEALTAIDRPYKKGKMLSEALQIMARMARESHIDPGLFRLFIQAGIHREYAGRHMKLQQIDAVDEAVLLAGVGD